MRPVKNHPSSCRISDRSEFFISPSSAAMDSPAFEPMKEGTQVLDQAGGWQLSDVRNQDLPKIPMAKLP